MRWQFTLRSFLVMTAVLCVMLAFAGSYVQRARQQAHTVQKLKSSGAVIAFDWEGGFDWHDSKNVPELPWLERQGVNWFGKEYVSDVAMLVYGGELQGQQDLAEIGALKSITQMQLNQVGEIDNDGLRHLRQLKRLQYLRLKATNLSAVGIRHLAGCPQLVALELTVRDLDEEAIQELCRMGKLEYLSLDGSILSDVQFRIRQALPKCNRLF